MSEKTAFFSLWAPMKTGDCSWKDSNSLGWLCSKESGLMPLYSSSHKQPCKWETEVQRSQLTCLCWLLSSSRGEYFNSGLFGPNAQSLSPFFPPLSFLLVVMPFKRSTVHICIFRCFSGNSVQMGWPGPSSLGKGILNYVIDTAKCTWITRSIRKRINKGFQLF